MEVADLLAHPTFMGVSLMQVRVLQQRHRPVPRAQVTAFVTRGTSSACVYVLPKQPPVRWPAAYCMLRAFAPRPAGLPLC